MKFWTSLTWYPPWHSSGPRPFYYACRVSYTHMHSQTISSCICPRVGGGGVVGRQSSDHCFFFPPIWRKHNFDPLDSNIKFSSATLSSTCCWHVLSPWNTKWLIIGLISWEELRSQKLLCVLFPFTPQFLFTPFKGPKVFPYSNLAVSHQVLSRQIST